MREPAAIVRYFEAHRGLLRSCIHFPVGLFHHAALLALLTNAGGSSRSRNHRARGRTSPKSIGNCTCEINLTSCGHSSDYCIRICGSGAATPITVRTFSNLEPGNLIPDRLSNTNSTARPCSVSTRGVIALQSNDFQQIRTPRPASDASRNSAAASPVRMHTASNWRRRFGTGNKTRRTYLGTNAAGSSVNGRDRIGRGPWACGKRIVPSRSDAVKWPAFFK